MTVFWIILATLTVLLITAVIVGLKISSRPWKPAPTVTVREALDFASGRPIIIGEHHGDKKARKLTLLLMEAAHMNGYRTLGVECSDTGHGKHAGLKAEVAHIAAHMKETLPEEHEHSELDPEDDGKRQRMNRHWHIQMALCLGWDVKSIDPNYWNHLDGDADGYLHSREPAMAKAISAGKPMIVVCGYGHLQGLHKLLGDSVVIVCATKPSLDHAPARTFWARRIKFAMRVPQLTA